MLPTRKPNHRTREARISNRFVKSRSSNALYVYLVDSFVPSDKSQRTAPRHAGSILNFEACCVLIPRPSIVVTNYMAPPMDSRRIAGTVVHSLAKSALMAAECRRLFGDLWDTVYISGIVVAQRQIFNGTRMSTLLTVRYNLLDGETTERSLGIRRVRAGPPPIDADTVDTIQRRRASQRAVTPSPTTRNYWISSVEDSTTGGRRRIDYRDVSTAYEESSSASNSHNDDDSRF